MKVCLKSILMVTWDTFFSLSFKAVFHGSFTENAVPECTALSSVETSIENVYILFKYCRKNNDVFVDQYIFV